MSFPHGTQQVIPEHIEEETIWLGFRSICHLYQGVWTSSSANGVRWTTRYHMLRNNAEGPQVSQLVDEGQVHGYVGLGGLSTGPHHHSEIHNKKRLDRELRFSR
ncbi:hypothetical protein GCM10027416_05900 [Okibacterium endophyticum]